MTECRSLFFCLTFLCALRPCAMAAASANCPGNTITAKVAAIEQIVVWNRFDSFNPSAMMYALERDLVSTNREAALTPGFVRLRDGKRPRPIVLRVNKGDCLEVTFRNLLMPAPPGPPEEIRRVVPAHVAGATGTKMVEGRFSNDFIATRAASMHVNGLDYLDIKADGANAGLNPSSLVNPGETTTYRWLGTREGTFFLYSMGAPVGGEGDGGQLGQGLFGAVIVEPENSRWFRSQVTYKELLDATPAGDYTKVQYDKLAILSGKEIIHTDLNAVVAKWHDLKGGEDPKQFCKDTPDGSGCYRSFREFTAIFHDEIKAVQAFAELADEDNPLSAIRDNMAINYGASGLGAMYLANRKKIGPGKDCKECLAEDFFLTSWVNGDPALVVERDKDGIAVRASYPADPSNVHHSYLGDPVWFRNIHAGPKETHVFHLHAHQWLMDRQDPNSTYLDSQTISPGSAFTYEIWYGGSCNRNFTVGDSIFHCHLYPHFAEGMWELWRVHDVFESGKPGLYGYNGNTDPGSRNLPDHEIKQGVETPALVPIPYLPLAPAPSVELRGYPFYIPGTPGRRPPQPPLDFTRDGASGSVDGGLPRHIVEEGERTKPGDPVVKERLFQTGGATSELIARRVDSLNQAVELTADMTEWDWLKLKAIPQDGTPEEKRAMQFHAGVADAWPTDLGWNKDPKNAVTHYKWAGRAYRTSNSDSATLEVNPLPDFNGKPWVRHPADQRRFLVNGLPSVQGAPYANPCPLGAPARTYKGAYIQFGLTVNKDGWHDPQARIAVLERDIKPILNGDRLAEPFFIRARSEECIEFHATNLIPNALNLDDFQVFTPTDTIGQHIHLVKFDVTSADGSANGWNYEDSTFSPDEVRERIHAFNKGLEKFKWPGLTRLEPKIHPMFRSGGAMAGDARGKCAVDASGEIDRLKHPWCGAQSTVQRWWADPLLSKVSAGGTKDRTIRTVFTHDHMGASSHQQHGMYAALVIEPKGSTWTHLNGAPMLNAGGLGKRADGGPTSYAANVTDGKDNIREYLLAIADFAIVYDQKLEPVNPPVKDESAMFLGHRAQAYLRPKPEAISSKDPGTQLFNYRNEPAPLRIAERSRDGDWKQRQGDRGDLANLFSSKVHAPADDEWSVRRTLSPPDFFVHRNLPLSQGNLSDVFTRLEDARQAFLRNLKKAEPWRMPGDPATPLLAAYENERMQIRLIQGSQEEQHTFVANGIRWRHQAGGGDVADGRRKSGYVAAQAIGISEYFEFNVNLLPIRSSGRADHFYASTSSENLWDGQWGILRAFNVCSGFSGFWFSDFGKHRQLLKDCKPLWRGVKIQDTGYLSKHLKFISTKEEVDAHPPAKADSVCPDTASGAPAPFVTVEVAAVRVCDLFENCGKQGSGLVYNSKFRLTDPNAIVYQELAYRDSEIVSNRTLQVKLDDLRALHRPALDGSPARPLEPLVIRAAAGSCIHVSLTNLLEVKPSTEVKDVSHNYLPPIADGLNFNQIQMSKVVGMHVPLLTSNVFSSDGSRVGYNGFYQIKGEKFTRLKAGLPPASHQDDSLVPPQKEAKFYWYAGDLVLNKNWNNDDNSKQRYNGQAVEFGAVPIVDFADLIKHASHSLVGAVIIEPFGANIKLPNGCKLDDTSDKCRRTSRLTADIESPTGKFRDFALVMHDDLSLQVTSPGKSDAPSAKHQPLPNLSGGEDAEDSGAKGFNYKTEPLWARSGFRTPAVAFEETRLGEYCHVLSSAVLPGAAASCVIQDKAAALANGAENTSPETAVFEAKAGSEVRFRVVHAGGHQRQHAFTLFGHNWQMLPVTPEQNGRSEDEAGIDSKTESSYAVGSQGGIAPGAHVNVLVRAGGACGIPGDYVYRSQPSFLFDGGMWGIFRVSGTEPNPSAKCKKSILQGAK